LSSRRIRKTVHTCAVNAQEDEHGRTCSVLCTRRIMCAYALGKGGGGRSARWRARRAR
jgi:hypothetical protein